MKKLLLGTLLLTLTTVGYSLDIQTNNIPSLTIKTTSYEVCAKNLNNLQVKLMDKSAVIIKKVNCREVRNTLAGDIFKGELYFY